MSTKLVLLVGASAGAVITALVGGIGLAAIPGPGGVIQGCYDSGGNVKVVEALPCPRNYTPFQWNQQGEPGAQGEPGQPGPPGASGADGTPFDGTFTSPNGEYSLSVTNDGITLAHGSDAAIQLAGSGITVETDGPLELTVGTNAAVSVGGSLSMQSGGASSLGSGSTFTVDADGNLTVQSSRSIGVQSDSNMTMQSGGTTALQAATSMSVTGAQVRLNPSTSCGSVARVGDTVAGGGIASGSSTVCAGG
jgi:hypothetical protein